MLRLVVEILARELLDFLKMVGSWEMWFVLVV